MIRVLIWLSRRVSPRGTPGNLRLNLREDEMHIFKKLDLVGGFNMFQLMMINLMVIYGD
jgi:hypothetical protein